MAIDLYDRQTRIKDWKQDVIANTKVSIIGAGALGTSVSTQLTCVGFGKINIFDFDVVENHNLNRQFLFFDSVGKHKSISLAVKLHFINPDVDHTPFTTKIDETTIDILKDSDLIVDCLDNWPSRILLNKFCVANKIPFVHGGMNGFIGQVQAYVPGKTPCLACGSIPKSKKRSNVCDVDPAIVTTSFVIGGLMAQEAIKIILYPRYVMKGLLLYNGLRNVMKVMKTKVNKSCKVCAEKKRKRKPGRPKKEK